MSVLLNVMEVAQEYSTRRSLFRPARAVRAVDGVSFRLNAGEVLGIVGESGSGKSTLGRIALGFERPSSGQVEFDGKAMPELSTREWRRIRRHAQMVYQNPLDALDQRLTIRDQIVEPLDIHGIGSEKDRAVAVANAMEAVGLRKELENRYPHELSGGQRQRAVIARALVTSPQLLICDEAVSALDVSIQAQIVNLLHDMQKRLHLGMVFISHDLRVVRHISDRVAVMYLGRIVEEGPSKIIFSDPLHPYTRALISAAPMPGKKQNKRIILKGEPPNPAKRPSGCAFHPRCALATDQCRSHAPLPKMDKSGQRKVACHVAEG